MTNGKHTGRYDPPLRFRRHRDGVRYIVNARGHRVVKVLGPLTYGESGHAEADALARAIAALPELLEIVTEIAGWSCDCDFPEPGERGVIICLACRASKAIRKARGEE